MRTAFWVALVLSTWCVAAAAQGQVSTGGGVAGGGTAAPSSASGSSTSAPPSSPPPNPASALINNSNSAVPGDDTVRTVQTTYDTSPQAAPPDGNSGGGGGQQQPMDIHSASGISPNMPQVGGPSQTNYHQRHAFAAVTQTKVIFAGGQAVKVDQPLLMEYTWPSHTPQPQAGYARIIPRKRVK